MLTGFILVVFLGALVTLGVTKGRRKMGLGVTNRTWVVSFLITVLVILAIWSSGHN